jgi:hypothetical protein
VEAIHERFHEDHPIVLRGRRHLLALRRIERERLLAKNVLSRLRRPDHPFTVHAVGQRDVHGVDGPVVEKRLVAAVGGRDAMRRSELLRARLLA